MRHRVPVAATTVALALFATACGGGSGSDVAAPAFVEQGAQLIESDSDSGDVATTTAADAGGSGGASEGDTTEGDTTEGDGPGGGTTTSTLPQNEETQAEQVDDLFTAMRTFNSCLEDEGHPFIGFDPDAPEDDPRRAPAYLEALGKCAAVSQIQEAMEAVDLGSEGKTPEEIEQQNRGLIAFSDCLKGRGWDPAPMQPDDNGLLQIGDLGAPDGENMLESDDLDECRRSAQDEAEADAEG